MLIGTHIITHKLKLRVHTCFTNIFCNTCNNICNQCSNSEKSKVINCNAIIPEKAIGLCSIVILLDNNDLEPKNINIITNVNSQKWILTRHHQYNATQQCPVPHTNVPSNDGIGTTISTFVTKNGNDTLLIKPLKVNLTQYNV